MNEARDSPPLLPSFLLGIGLGGFVDGILLHQVLQWHHMLSSEGCCSTSTVGGLEDNTLADGLFHLASWIAGIVDHEILGIHHVRDDLGGPIGWDLGFLAFGLALALVGWALVQRGRRSAIPAAVPGSRQRAI